MFEVKLHRWFVSEHVNSGFVYNYKERKKDFQMITSRSKSISSREL